MLTLEIQSQSTQLMQLRGTLLSLIMFLMSLLEYLKKKKRQAKKPHNTQVRIQQYKASASFNTKKASSQARMAFMSNDPTVSLNLHLDFSSLQQPSEGTCCLCRIYSQSAVSCLTEMISVAQVRTCKLLITSWQMLGKSVSCQ